MVKLDETMRAFFILGFLVAAASAASLGYNFGTSGTAGSTGSVQVVNTKSNYVQPATNFVSGSGIVGRSASGSTTYVSDNGFLGNGIVKETFVQPASTYISGRSGFVGGAVVQPSSTYVSGNTGFGGLSGSLNNVEARSSLLGSSILSSNGNSVKTGGTTVISLDALDSIPQSVEYNKQVYFFSAPEEEQSQGIVNQQLSNILKKNLQVVFIKAPENNAATNAAIQLAKQAIEQRTAIYVLSKENDANQVVGQLQQIQESVQTAPEVAIIKYRTAQDLANAQANIQAQYDSFGGVVPVINGGIVPVLNYASPASSSGINFLGTANLSGSGVKVVSGSNSIGQSSGGSIISSGLQYLPPIALKK